MEIMSSFIFSRINNVKLDVHFMITLGPFTNDSQYLKFNK